MLEALDECSRTRDKDTAVMAGLLKAASTQPDFVVALCPYPHFSFDSFIVSITPNSEYRPIEGSVEC